MNLAPDTERDLARFCRRVVRDERFPGLSVAVVDRDGTAFVDGFGSRDLAGNRPATPRTLYGVASCTKSVAAVAICQLVENGMCALDDEVGEYLPVDLGAPVTVHHLLTHTSGLPSLGVSETLLARRLRIPDPGVPLGDAEDVYAHVDGAADERIAPPGERFAYCNTGYALLGDLVAELTGKPFDEYVESHVLAPLGMERSTFDDHAFSVDDDHMTPYRIDADGDLLASSLPTREVGRAAGGLLAPVDELARYVRAHLNGGTVDGTHLLDPGTLERAHAGHVGTPDGAYGYGWFRDDDFLGHTLLGHSGSITVSSAYLGFLPDEGVGVALGANTSPSYPLGVVGRGVLATVLGEDPDESVAFFRRRRRHERLTGQYSAYEGVMNARVEAAGNALQVSFQHPLNRATKPLYPAEEVVADDGDVAGGGAVAEGADDDADVYRYFAIGESGQREPVEFRVGDGDVSLLVDRWHLHRE